MRNTDFLSFDISSIKHSDASANFYSSPNGFNWFRGMSNHEICRS